MRAVQYICCAHRPWNIRAFHRHRDQLPGEWLLITTPEALRSQKVNEHKPAKIFLLDWSWKVPSSITSQTECIGFHPTNLPYGRGGSPYQNLILRHQYVSVLTAFRLTDEIDAGPVYLKKTIYLFGRAEDFFEEISEIAFEMISEIINKSIEPNPQRGEVVKFRRRKEKDSELSSELPDLPALYDFIRMLDAPGYPKAYLDFGRFRLLFSRPCFSDGELEASVRITLRGRSRHD